MSVQERMPGYRFIAETFSRYEVDHIFYVEAMLRMAMRECGRLGMRRIMAHTENAAAYMADGYTRMSGKPGICLAQSIGAANLAGGIHEAWLACSPVIALTGKKPPAYQYRGCYQEADHRLLYEGITKFNGDISDPQQLGLVLRQCFREAVTGKPRPVHADLSNHIGRIIELGEVWEPVQGEAAFRRCPAHRPGAEAESVRLAAAELDRAQRPVAVVGRGAMLSDAGEAIAALVERASLPFVTTPDGKSVLDEGHPLWRGVVGAYGMDCANRTVRAADLVIFIGTQAGDQATIDWSVPTPDTRVIQIDLDPAELGKNYPCSIGLLGDARRVTRQLEACVEQQAPGPWVAESGGYLEETLVAYARQQRIMQVPIRPERLCAELSRHLPGDAVLVSDTGYSAVWSGTMLRMKATQRYLRAAGSLGWAYPASLGVKCAAPDRPVVCFTGDGAFYYHLSEMETAVRNGIPTVTVLNNNGALCQCRQDLNLVYREEPEKIPERYQYREVDFAALAETFGCWSRRVERPEEVGPALEAALTSGRPSVLDVRTDQAAEVPSLLEQR